LTSRNILSIVTTDLFKRQFKWTMAFLGMMLLVNLLKIGQGIIYDTGIDDYFSLAIIAGNIYMFVIGIICIFFLKYFVEHGVTRKDYSKGSLIVATSLAIIIPIITFVIYKLQMLTIGNLVQFNESHLNDIATDIDKQTSIIDDIVVALSTAPYIDPNEQAILALGIFSLNLLFNYLAGWLIGAAFQFPLAVGLGTIAVTGGLIVIQDALVRIFLEIPVLPRFEFMIDTPKPVTILSILILLGTITLIIQRLTKKTVVKM